LTNNQYLPSDISYYQIVKVELEPIRLCLRLEFIDPISLKEIALELNNMVYFSLSKTPDDEEGCYLLGEIKLSSINVSDREALLSQLGYGFIANQDINFLNTMYYLHIEGDICLEAVCEYYKLLDLG
jgi:hypothetical protein